MIATLSVLGPMALSWAALACADPALRQVAEGHLPTQSAADPLDESPRAHQSFPTFARNVAPIIYEHCTTCHRRDGPAPFSLRSYEEVAPLAERISQVTSSRRMPPWQPEPEVGRFANERRLTESEIGIIRRWVRSGAPEGDPSVTPDPPRWAGGWQLGNPDLVIRMDTSFPVPAGGADLFRNFVIPIPTEETRWVQAVELRPGNPRVVHHATMLLDRSRFSRHLAGRDSTPGFEGMHAGGRAAPPPGFVLGWTPGRVPSMGDGDLSWRLEPETDLVLQLHLRPRGRRESVRASVGFYFADEPARKDPVVLRLASETLDIPPGEDDYKIKDGYELPVPVRLRGLHPHAHYLAREMEVWADLPDGTRLPLLRIADWNFDWQDFYRLEKPVPLPRGTVLQMRYTYDNSAGNPQNPNDPPRPVTYGPTSTDEMGDLWIQVVPVDSADVALLRRDFARKDLATRMAGWRHAIRVRPNEARGHYGLGTVLFRRGWTEEAIGHLREAVEADPKHPHAHYHLALALQSQGSLEEALESYREAVRVDPLRADVHYSLALALVSSGQPDEGIRTFRQGARLKPDAPRAHVVMAWALATAADISLRRPGVAADLAERASEQYGGRNPSALAALAAAYAARSDFALATTEAERALTAASDAGNVRLMLLVRQHLARYRAEQMPDYGSMR